MAVNSVPAYCGACGGPGEVQHVPALQPRRQRHPVEHRSSLIAGHSIREENKMRVHLLKESLLDSGRSTDPAAQGCEVTGPGSSPGNPAGVGFRQGKGASGESGRET